MKKLVFLFAILYMCISIPQISFAQETGWSMPFGTGPGSAYNIGGGAFRGDSSYTVFDIPSDDAFYYNFTDIHVSPNKILAIPPEKVIKGIEVSLRGFRTESSDFQFIVNLKGNGTANWTEGKTTTGLIFNSTSPKTSTTQVLGSPTDNWGLWSYSHLEGSTFLVKVSVSGTTGDAWLDGVLVKVYYGDPVLPFIVNTTGKFKVPADITSLTAKVWGGGGGGAIIGFNGLGGGGGGFGTGTFNITSGELIDITVGTGGLGAIGSRLNGYDGNLSKVMWSTGSITASAGRGGGFDGGISPGTGGTGSSTGTVTNTSFFFGGNGASGSSGNGGGGGGGAGDHANGTYASGTSGGSGGNQSGGNGGNGSTDTNVGGNGQSYSGGGGGGSTLGLYGGNGADGAVIISLPVLGYPAPTIVGPETVCAYSPFTLTANGESGATYSWSGPLGFTSTDQNPQITINSTVIPSPINFTYYVTQTVNGSISDPASITIAVYNKPNPGLFVYTARDVCEGTQYTVEFNVTPEPGGTWSSTDPAIAAVDNNGVVTGISLGTATISYTVTNSVGCTASRSIEITVTSFKAEITRNNGPIIYDGTAEFYLTGTPGAILTYLINGQPDPNVYQQYWFNEDGSLTLTFPNATVDQTLTLVSLSRPNFCSKTLTGTSTVTVNPLPPCSNPSIQLGAAEPACIGSYGAYLSYSNLTNYEGTSRLIIVWDSPGMPDVDVLLKNYLDFPDAGFLYLPLEQELVPGTYSGTLKIQTRDCTSEEYPFEITINTPPFAPEASNSGPVCAGSKFTLSANGEDGATYIWYTDWSEEFWWVETSDKSIEIQTDETWVGNFTYGLVQYVGGCYSETATTTVTVNPLPCCPNPPAIALGTAEPVCSEQVWIVLPYSDLMNFNPADGNLLIAWDSSDLEEFNYNGPANERFGNISGVGLCIAIHIPDVVSGTYTGTITLTNASECISSAYPFTATIKELLPKPTIEVIEGSTEICEEGSVTFKATGAEGAQYIWYQGGYEISKGQTFSKEFGTPGEPTQYYTYEVTQALSDEIGNPLCESEKASIIVTHSRKPYGGNILTSDKMCTGTTKSVTWYNAPDEGGTYKSSNTDVATVDQNGLVTAILAGTADISYSLTGQGACSGITVTSTEKFDVYDNYAEITGNNSPVCEGDAAKFYIDAPANRIIYYKLNDIEQAPIGTNQIIADGGFLEVSGITESMTLTLVSVEYPGYCTKEINQSSIVIANSIPVTSVSPQTSEITEGASITLTASGADSYSWSSVPAGFSSTDAAVSVTPLKNTTYIVTGTSNGCSSSDDAIIYVKESCKSSGDQYEPNNSMSDNLFTIPVELTISANLLNAKDPDWYRLDISSPAKYTLKLTKTGTVSPSVDLYGSNGRKVKSIDRTQPNSYNLSSGTYYIKVSAVTKTYLCYTLQVANEGVAGALASFDDTKSSKIIEPISDGIIKIWPNPTRNEFELYNGHENPVQVRVMDVIGRTIETIENVGITETIVFGSKYKPGIYFVETVENGTQKVFKLVKQ
jgi:hypothetical protein